MSRKHNAEHPRRGISNYPKRLAKRGVTSSSVRMPSLEQLRRKQRAGEVDVFQSRYGEAP